MRKLVVFHSYTGNTRLIVDKIKNKMECDVLELEPKESYSEDYQTVVDEYQNNETAKTVAELKEYNIDLSKYDEIIIGSPVWWYSITPVIRAFLKENDLTGKTVIPFATNAGWLGRTLKEFKKLCPNSKVEKEMNIVFAEDYREHKIMNEKEVNEWLEKI